MVFDLNTDFGIFDALFEKRPEIDRDALKKDLERYYLPFAKRLIEIKEQKDTLDGVIIGVSAIQGAGKTTQGEIIDILLSHLGHETVSLSIDDHYVTHAELCKLRESDPRYIRRGVTHDIPLAILNLRDLKTMRDYPIIVSGYDKGANHGDGERFRWVNLVSGAEIKLSVVDEVLTVDKKEQSILAIKLNSLFVNGQEIPLAQRMGSDVPLIENILPDNLINFLKSQDGQEITLIENDNDSVKFSGKDELVISKKELPHGWQIITKKPDFIFYDGWMLGTRMVEDESVFESGLPGLETPDDVDFAKMINKKLENYEPLWEMLDYLNMLYVPDYKVSIKWRDQAETHLREKGEGMTEQEIVDFVHYFWRSVHPAIQIENLAKDTRHTSQVVIINDDHSIDKITTPQELST